MMNSNINYIKPVLRVAEALAEANVPFSFNNAHDGAQLRFSWCDGDVVCHEGSYGHSTGMVESYCFPWDNGDVTMLSPTMAIEKIINYYKETIDNQT